MAQSYFIWNGIDCRAMGVRLAGPVAVTWPEERIGHINIPGRSGDLTELEGTDIYNSYIQTAEIKCRDWARLGLIKKWLRGSGYVTFSGEPNRKQQARIIGAVTLNKHSRNMDLWEGSVQFYCQPFKEYLQSRTDNISPGGAILNHGDVTEEPDWSFIATASTATITTADGTFTLNGLTSGLAYLICSDIQMAMTADKLIDLTQDSSGEFPKLTPGQNTVTGSGWDQITVWRRERFF